MRIKNSFLLFCSFIILNLGIDTPVHAQFFDGGEATPRLMLGGAIGNFRVSYEDFKKVYGERSGSSNGGFASFLVKVPYNVIIKYREFQKTGTYTPDDITYNLDWNQRIINVGLRYFRPGKKGFSNHFGFGFAIIKIEEKGEFSLFDSENRAPKTNDAGGFFLDFGVHYTFNRFVEIFTEMEITSAGIEGKSGFEGSSVGGYYFSFGVAVMPF
ncbi:MAG: hypothetical protein DWQ05_15935 [Calditrichaeota bacterium]|nr:MAG: hypothetical protein DWQ05_15935 [Calditrichota bacterium]